MASEGGGGGEESVPCSPKSKVKFLCSYGGNIMPRPIDGHLKYVGGETRVVAIHRDINFSELMKKLSTIYDGDMVVKYQLIKEDLDALVTVRTDEDLKHMIDEYDRHESEGTPKLRAFLFPSNQFVIENQTAFMEPHAVEQRYIDAINGIVRTTSNLKLAPVNAYHPSFSLSSTCSSPKSNSPDSNVNSMPHESILMNAYQNNRLHMHKVQSSPSLCSLNTTPYQSINVSNHHLYQQHHPYYQNHQQHQHHSHYRPPQDPQKAIGTERPPPGLAVGQADFVRVPMGHGSSPYYLTNRNQMGSGGYNKYGHHDESSVHRYSRLERTESLPRSPRKNMWENGPGSDYGISS